MSESFADLFNESLQRSEMRTGEVITAEVVRIDHNHVVVNAGLKSEAYVPLEEFKNDQGELEVQPGDFVSVGIDAVENGAIVERGQQCGDGRVGGGHCGAVPAPVRSRRGNASYGPSAIGRGFAKRNFARPSAWKKRPSAKSLRCGSGAGEPSTCGHWTPRSVSSIW